MGFLSSSVSLTRYKIIDKIEDNLIRNIPEKLRQFCFREIENSMETRAFGWTSINDMLDCSWEKTSPHKGSYFAFALRLETRRIPPAVFKKYYNIELQKLESQNQEQGRDYITKSQKNELKERVEFFLKPKMFPIPAIFDVVWDISNHTVYFCSTQKKVLTLFEEEFLKTFQLHLEPMQPVLYGLTLLNGQEDLFKNIEASSFA